MALDCTLVDIDSMFYTSVQGTYFYQVIFGTKFKFSENQSTLRFHYSYRAPSILLRSRHYERGHSLTTSHVWLFLTLMQRFMGHQSNVPLCSEITSFLQESVPAWISSIWFRYKMWRNVGFVLKIAKSGLFFDLKLTESNNNIYFFSWFSAHELICDVQCTYRKSEYDLVKAALLFWFHYH